MPEGPYLTHRRSVFLDGTKHEAMINYLYQQLCSHRWVSDGSGEVEGVLLRKSRGQYMACSPNLGTSPFAFACAALKVQCALTVDIRVIEIFLQWSPDAVDVSLTNGHPSPDLTHHRIHLPSETEDKLAAAERTPGWSQHDEAHAIRDGPPARARKRRLCLGRGQHPGDYIFLIGSDTHVPADCFLDAVSEMNLSPDVGVMQFRRTSCRSSICTLRTASPSSLIYTATRYVVSNGEVAPFVGHNAILRWSTIQRS